MRQYSYTNLTGDASTFPLDYFERHCSALLECRAGSKEPVSGYSWKAHSTHDRAKHNEWLANGSNVAIDAAKSDLILLDVDVSVVGKTLAWGAYVRFLSKIGIPSPRTPADPFTPQTISARGGWHIYVRRPAGIAPEDLRGVGVLVRVSDVRPLAEGEKDGEVIGFRNRGYCVAPPSFYDGTPEGKVSGHYQLLPDAAPPFECPDALIEMLRLPAVTAPTGKAGESDCQDVAGLVAFLDAHDEFDTEPEWFKALGAIKLACGDTLKGIAVALEMTTSTYDEFWQRWRRLSTEPRPRDYKLASLIWRALQLGWKGTVRRSAAAMFGSMGPIQKPSNDNEQQQGQQGESLLGGAAPRLPVITIEAGTLDRLATAGEQALIAAGVPFYAHADEIQRPIVDEVEASKGRKTSIARLATVTPDMLRDYLSRSARWERYNIRAKRYVPADPPRDVAAIILSREGEWQFPRAVGVITTPTLRPDGTILAEPGYDPATRLILMSPPAMPQIPETPTRAAAAAALQFLDDLLEEFPFVDDASRSVALSELITPVVRGAMPVAPLHANRAPTPGSGKSFLVDIASAICSGQPCPVISAGTDEFETEKRLGAALLKGQALITIDNLNGELRGDALCQMIERPIVEVRPLGVSRLVRIESRATLFATGNNIVLVGDVVRRVLLCSLDPDVERPEMRQFKSRPFDTVMAARGNYIAAALIVVRAYFAAGCPNAQPALASFEDWSRMVRSALVWLGRADPVQTMETARAGDPELDELRRVVAAWLNAIGPDRPHSAGQMKEAAEKYEGLRRAHPDLNEALMSVAYGSGGIDARKLGHWLGRKRGRIVSGHKLTSRDDSHSKQMLWYLTPVRQ